MRKITGKEKREKMGIFEKIMNFIKYHNAFVFVILGIFIFMGTVLAASPEIRNTIIGGEVVSEQGVDNSQLLSADLENFNINLKIDNVSEDEENYYIDYSFNTIAVRDNIWQPIIKSEKFTVNKTALGDRDLGVYLAEELSQVARSEMVFLKEAQKNEKERGITHVVKTTNYTGLIGLTLDLKNRILGGYEPVIKPPVAEIVQIPSCLPATEVCDGIDNNCDGQVDEGGVCSAIINSTEGEGPIGGASATSTDSSTSTSTSTSTQPIIYYYDNDGDGYGTQNNFKEGGSQPEGYVLNNQDCDDWSKEVNPAATEICDDGIDNNCDGKIDAQDVICQQQSEPGPTPEATLEPTTTPEPEPTI